MSSNYDQMDDESRAAEDAYMDEYVQGINELRGHLAACEQEIEVVTERVNARGRFLMEVLDEPEVMDYKRQMGTITPEGEQLDGLFTQYAALQAEIDRRLHDLGYM